MNNDFMNGSMPNAMRQEQQRRRRRRIVSVLMAWILAILIVATVLFCVVTLIRAAGGRSLREEVDSTGPDLTLDMDEILNSGNDSAVGGNPSSGGEAGSQPVVTPEPTAAPSIWKEGWVRYNDKVYEYNTDILTFLVMGIDHDGVVKESSSPTGGGQADANFLIVVNPDKKDISLIAINRDTMTEIEMYGMGPDGTSITTIAQLATQHGFGGGTELSCALSKKAVSKLFYNLPIHGYLAVNIGAFAKINDAVGGVELTALETIPGTKIKEGQTITLKGSEALRYVQSRDCDTFESSRSRLARQKQYLTAFVAKLKEAMKSDITLPLTVYQQLSKYMVTDVSTQEVTYLAGELLDYNFNLENVYTLEGETKMGERHEEFYPDKAALKELMIELFYREVEGY